MFFNDVVEIVCFKTKNIKKYLYNIWNICAKINIREGNSPEQ